MYSLSYFQFIMTLEMLKSDPSQNAIANNLDDDDDDDDDDDEDVNIDEGEGV